MKKYDTNNDQVKLKIKDKVTHMLEEIRIVLPGTQTLLGFQFVAIFSNGFDKLSSQLQQLHLLSLGSIVFAMICIMIPPAYHRIADKGNDTERFHTLASMLIVTALFFLALGIAIDLYVVIGFISKNLEKALYISGGMLLFSYVAWFIFPFLAQRSGPTGN